MDFHNICTTFSPPIVRRDLVTASILLLQTFALFCLILHAHSCSFNLQRPTEDVNLCSQNRYLCNLVVFAAKSISKSAIAAFLPTHPHVVLAHRSRVSTADLHNRSLTPNNHNTVTFMPHFLYLSIKHEFKSPACVHQATPCSIQASAHN